MTIAPTEMQRRLWSLQARLAPYLFIAPFVILFVVFMAYPMLRSLVMSLYQTAGARTRFVGVQNYTFLVHDRLFWLALLNTVGYTVAFILLQTPTALLLAILLNGKAVRARSIFRFAFFVPALVGQVFVAVIFTLMLANNGPVNEAIRLAWPRAQINWMTDWRMARPAVVLAATWLSVGFGMIYFLAALQGVETDLYEAAEVDGAGRWSRFWHVTLPGIRPVLTFLILTTTIGGLQLFELPYVLFNGPGPGGAGLTVVAYLFGWVEAGELGTAAASGWALALAVIVVALVQVRVIGESGDRARA